jgi:hypothetical protein
METQMEIYSNLNMGLPKAQPARSPTNTIAWLPVGALANTTRIPTQCPHQHNDHSQSLTITH